MFQQLPNTKIIVFTTILGMVLITISVVIGIQIGKHQTSSQPIPVEENKNKILLPTSTPSSNKVIEAELFIPEINGKLSSTFIAYVNYDYNFSFFFPAKWRVDLSDNHMEIGKIQSRGGGGFSGISLIHHQNIDKLSIIVDNLKQYTTKNTDITVYIDRQTPGAGPGQTAYITNNNSNETVELYCGNCSDIEMNDIVSSFNFEKE